MIDPILGIDTWQGQLEIDEAVLKANGVKFIFVRLNSMSGRHHKDTGFDKQWAEAAGFYRAPYFVYNPWVTGQANFDWLAANMPADAHAVALDMEVIMPGYPAVTYGAEFKKFKALASARWKAVIYTGEGYLSMLTPWDTTADYWWAEYPFEFYSAPILPSTWDDLRKRLMFYAGPGNAAKIPGRLKFWQFSGDKLILPGNPHAMDVNVFFGNEAQLAEFFGGTPTPVPTAPADVVTPLYDGSFTHVEGVRNGWRFHLFAVDPAKCEYEFPYLQPLETISSVARRTGAALVVPGGEWDRVANTKDYTVWNGKTIIPRTAAGQVSLMVLADNSIVIDHKNAAGVRQALSGVTVLIENGTINTALFDKTKADNLEGHARNAFGKNAAGHLMLLVVEGVFPNQGLTHAQTAALLWEYGAVQAFFASGGGDVAASLNGVPLILPENINPINQQHFERPLPQVVTVRPKLGAPKPMTTYTVKAKANATKIFKNPDGSAQIASLNTSDIAKADATGAFVHLISKNNIALNGYVDATKVMLTADPVPAPTPTPTPPPTPTPTTGTITASVTINPDAKTFETTVTWSDGTTTRK